MKTIGKYAIHPAADMFPMLEASRFDEFVADIHAHGQQDPIVRVWEGAMPLVLDGRNRLRACIRLGIEPRFRDFEGTDDVAYVISANLHRRHLNESQRAMVAARLPGFTRGGDRRSRLSLASVDVFSAVAADASPDAKNIVAVADRATRLTQAQAAALMNVSERSVQSAKRVVRLAIPDLVKAVTTGSVSVKNAAEIARLPPADQRKILDSDDRVLIAKARSMQRRTSIPLHGNTPEDLRHEIEMFDADQPVTLTVRVLRDVLSHHERLAAALTRSLALRAKRGDL